MGDEDRGEVTAARHLGQEIQELGAPGRIHAGGGLVEQQQARVVGQGSSQKGPLGLSAGEPGHGSIGESLPPDTREERERPFALVALDAERPGAAAAGHHELHDRGRKVRSKALALGEVAHEAPRGQGDSPNTRRVPAEGASRPRVAFKNVVLPPPFGPQRQTNSPTPTEKLTSSRTRWPPRSTLR